MAQEGGRSGVCSLRTSWDGGRDPWAGRGFTLPGSHAAHVLCLCCEREAAARYASWWKAELGFVHSGLIVGFGLDSDNFVKRHLSSSCIALFVVVQIQTEELQCQFCKIFWN